MSLFQLLSMWTLRALIVWAAIEAGARLYETGLAEAARLTELAGHRAAIHRLEQRAGEAETRARAAEAELAASLDPAWPIAAGAEESLADAAVRVLREDLIALGAQAAVVEASPSDSASPHRRVRLAASWREPAETSPFVLHALAARHPRLKVERLALAREDLVRAELVMSARVAGAPQTGAAP